MKVALKPIIQTFKLEADPDGEATITVRQAREGENIERAAAFAETTRSYSQDSDDVQIKQRYNRRELVRLEAYLTLGSVTGIIDEDGQELFKAKNGKEGPSVREGMSQSDFNRSWGALSPDVVAEIVGYIYDVNPTWDFTRSGE